ncbi:MAG: hypothetical protein ACRERD_12250 [Candidatus Binatia bacterium]
MENFPQLEPGAKTRDIAAKKAGFGNARTYQQAKRVVEAGTTALDKLRLTGVGECEAASPGVISTRASLTPRSRVSTGDAPSFLPTHLFSFNHPFLFLLPLCVWVSWSAWFFTGG